MNKSQRQTLENLRRDSSVQILGASESRGPLDKGKVQEKPVAPATSVDAATGAPVAPIAPAVR